MDLLNSIALIVAGIVITALAKRHPGFVQKIGVVVVAMGVIGMVGAVKLQRQRQPLCLEPSVESVVSCWGQHGSSLVEVKASGNAMTCCPAKSRAFTLRPGTSGTYLNTLGVRRQFHWLAPGLYGGRAE